MIEVEKVDAFASDNRKNQIRKMICIKVKSREEEFEVADKLHRQLAGNDDYVNSRIVLNMSKDRDDDTENEVHVYIFDDSKTTPELRI